MFQQLIFLYEREDHGRTVATNPAVVGEVCVRSLAIMLTGGDPEVV